MHFTASCCKFISLVLLVVSARLLGSLTRLFIVQVKPKAAPDVSAFNAKCAIHDAEDMEEIQSADHQTA